MNELQIQRLKKLSLSTVKYIILGMLYYIFIKLTGLRLPCVSYTLFDFHCPGCGLTRMCIAMIEGNFKLAFRQNAFMFSILPLILIWALVRGCMYIFNENKKISFSEKIVFIILFFGAVIFSILRNLPAYEFLAPVP